MSYFEYLVASRFSLRATRPFSKLIVRIAIVGIALGLAVMLASVAILDGFKGTIRDKLNLFNGDLQISRLGLNGAFENRPYDFDALLLKKVKAAAPEMTASLFEDKAGIVSAGGNIEGVIFRGITNSNMKFLKMHLSSGLPLRLSESGVSSDVLISRVIADRLKVSSGDKLLVYFVQQPLRIRKVFVRGIFDMGIEELDKTFIVGDLRLIQKLDGLRQTEAGGLTLTLTGTERAAGGQSAQEKLNKVVPVELKVFSVKELFPALSDWLSLTDVNVQIIVVLMLLVAGINMISALLIMILEKTPTIGLLKAVGGGDTSIRVIFLLVAGFLIGIGMILGNAVGLGFCWLQYSTHLVRLNSDVYYMSYVPIKLNLRTILSLNVGTLVTCLIMLLGPSYLVTRLNTLKAIRFK